jgi:predicted deacetylase
MRHVIIRDDDTNALTPIECLERLYRPALDRGLPINLATIPEVTLNACTGEGKPEGFLHFRNGHTEATMPIGSNSKLVSYLKENHGYEILQHGLHHDYAEFERTARTEVPNRLERGTRLLTEAGFARPRTFVAPHDKFSRASLREVAKRFQVVSSGWYEMRRLPYAWWPNYAWKKVRSTPHWRMGNTLLLSHPGCLLSCFRDFSASLDAIVQHVNSRPLTVLVTHWWEYFREGKPDEKFIDFLHETLEYLAKHPEVKVIRFSELVDGNIPLN